MRSPARAARAFALALALALPAAAFDFAVSPSTLTACAAVNISWTGGQAPFFLTVIPAFDYPTNISIPDSAYAASTQAGSYAWTVDYPGGTNLVFAMSDATGFAAGGVSNTFQVANSSASCTQRSTSTNWEFYLNETTVAQCEPVEIYWDTAAVAPVTIIGVIPQGQAFVLEGQSSSDSLVWDVNIASGTSFILAAWDSGSSASTGGSSNLLTVAGGSSACLNSNSPSSTPVSSPTSTQTSGSAASTTKKAGGIVTVTAITTAVASGSGMSTGAIVGAVVGVVLVVFFLQAAIVWFCCRRQLLAYLGDRKRRRSRARTSSSASKRNELDLVSSRGSGGGGPHSIYALAPSGSRASITSAPEESSTISPFLDPEGMRRGSDFGSPLMGGLMGGTGWDGAGLPSPHDSTPEGTLAGGAGPSRAPLPANPTKRALLAATNPDDGVGPYFAGDRGSSTRSSTASAGTRGTGTDELALDARLPPLAAPRGGFRRHEDAGPVARPAPAEHEVEDLPPNYDPEWERSRPQ